MPRNSRKHTPRRRLRFETLNQRICLAIDAAIDGGLLTVRGGEDDDSVWIGDDGHGSVSVRDLETGGAWEFEEVRSVVVATAGGADTIAYRRESGPAALPELTFETGAGTDSLDVRIEFSGDGDAPQTLDLDIGTDSGDDDVTVGLLLPAVQKVREAAARAEVDLGDGENQFEFRSERVGQVALDLTAGEDDDSILIGLLLPAVQKVRAAADPPPSNVDLTLTTNGGDDDVTVGLLLPAVQKVREAAARVQADLGDGDDRFDLRAIGVTAIDTVLALGNGDDDASISLLLPVGQKVRASVARTNVDLGPGDDRLQLRIRGYETVETTTFDPKDPFDDGS